MNTSDRIFLSFLFLLGFLGYATFIYLKWWIGRKQTRERFAFFSVRIFAGFMITLITLLVVRNQLMDAVIAGINDIFGYHIADTSSTDTVFASIFILVCAGMLLFLIISIHRNWNGTLSTRQVDLAETGSKVSILQDHQYYLRHRNEIEIYQKKPKQPIEVFSPFEPDTRPWHTKAANLFSLIDQQYIIKDEDWYGEYRYYISRYGQDHEKLGIFCVEEPPTEREIEVFVEYINSRDGKFHKLIVAIKGEGELAVQQIGGHIVEFRYESEMLDRLIPLAKYKDFIDQFFQTDELENSTLSLSDMYVPLEGYDAKIEKNKLVKDQPIASVESYVLDWAKGARTNAYEHLAILGEYGQGKTVLMYKIVKEMLAHPDIYHRIPILIELRGLSPRNDDELAIFGRWANRFQAKAEALWELHRAGKLFIILDGFDEMDLVGDTELLFSHFNQLLALARVPNAQLLVAGRPNLFADDEERRMALGIQPPRIELPYTKAVYLDKLTPSQIEQVLRSVQPDTKKGIIEAMGNAEKSTSFAELISRPSTLYQLSTVWDFELSRQKDRLNSAVVIGSFLQKAYDRQEKKAASELTSIERHYFMMGIATGMMLEGGYSNQIIPKALNGWVKQLWEAYPAQLPPYQDAMQGHAALKSLPVRLRENIDPLGTILKDVRAAGVLVQDLSGRDTFKFAHKSYLEYLISVVFCGYILQIKHDRNLLMMVNAIAKATGFSRDKLKASPDVEQFTAELIASKIELTDTSGNPLPIADNAEKYSRELYKMLILKTYPLRGRLWPNPTGWMSMHPDQNQFLAIGLLALFFFTSFFLLQNEILRICIVVCNSLLCFLWAGIILKYRFSKHTLQVVKSSDYLLKVRLYQNTCSIIGSPVLRISPTLRRVLENMHKQTAYLEFAGVALAVYIAFSGAIAEAFALSCTFSFAGAGAVISAIAVPGAFAFSGAYIAVLVSSDKGAFSTAIAVAGIAAVAGVSFFSFAFSFTGAFAVAGVVAVIGTSYVIWKLSSLFKKAYKDLTEPTVAEEG